MRRIETIGILGGGQLGRMLTLEAKRMGYRVVTLEPLPNSPCGQVADEQIVAAYDDLRAIGELGARSDVVTYEFENIPLESVLTLEAQGRLVRPNADVLRVTQDRIFEKTFIRDAGCVQSHLLPRSTDAAIARTRDRGDRLSRRPQDRARRLRWERPVGRARRREQAHAALADARGVPTIYERFVPFDLEVSVICARGNDGTIVSFPVTENQHDHGVLATTIVPARVDHPRLRRR